MDRQVDMWTVDLKVIQQSEQSSLVGDARGMLVTVNGLVTARKIQHVALPRASFVHRARRLAALRVTGNKTIGAGVRPSPSSVRLVTNGANSARQRVVRALRPTCPAHRTAKRLLLGSVGTTQCLDFNSGHARVTRWTRGNTDRL